MIKILLLLSLIYTTHGITFMAELNKKARIDILVSQLPPVPQKNPLIKRFIDPSLPIAHYAMSVRDNGFVVYSGKKYGALIGLPINPEDRISFTNILTSPLTVELKPLDINEIARESLSEAYVVIRQLTYRYVPSLKNNIFFDYIILFEGYVSVSSVLHIQASGMIAPSLFSQMPQSIQLMFPQAIGSVF